MDDAGSIDHGRDCLGALAEAAFAEADAVFGPLPDSPAKDLLLSATALVLDAGGSVGRVTTV